MNAGQGSTGNVIAALCSFFVPGLGQLLQGRVLAGLFFFVITGVLWLVTFTMGGWIGHVWACINAAMYKPRG